MIDMRQKKEQPLGLAEKQDTNLILMTADRYSRASSAMEPWAADAKKAVQYVEGKQWSAEEIKLAEDEGRPARTMNKIGSLVRLVLGYHRNNRTDVKYLPGHDGTGTSDIATTLTNVAKQIAEQNHEQFVDTEVFLDGMVSGRGFYDTRLTFDRNDFGEAKIVAKDPFSIKLDPDADQYDINSGSFVMEDRWVCLDEIAFTYGQESAAFVAPLVTRSGYSGMPSSYTDMVETITPWRTFGGSSDSWSNPYMAIESYLSQAIDPYRKNVRLVDMQHYIRVHQRCIIDLETGDREAIPDHFGDDKVKKILEWAQYTYAKRGKISPLRVAVRPTRRVRWTTMIGDIVVYDNWSPYKTFTVTPFFPYFRRGQTRGMVDDLIDPQNIINKHLSMNEDILSRTAHSGWKYHKDSLTEDGKERLENYGAAPGLNLEWQGEPGMEPKKIESSNPPVGFERLGQQASQDLKEISGVNESLLGIVSEVQSGRALEAKQKGGVMSIQSYMDNMSRTKELMGVKKLEIIQQHYTENRIVRIRANNGTQSQIEINKRDEISGQIANDLTVGKYQVVVDETPLSASFVSAQFDELIQMVEKGILPVQAVQDVIIDVSSIPQKELVKERLQMFMQAQGIPVQGPDGELMQPPQPQQQPSEGMPA